MPCHNTMETPMQIARLLATHIEGGHPTNNRFTLLCGIDGNNHLVNGEWFGYTRTNQIEYPFVLRHGDLHLCGGENYYERTNLESHQLQVGEYFSIRSSSESKEEWEVTYQITNLTILAR
jgi:hypothetical protein